MKSLSEKVILITGAGQGLGAATAEVLADAGGIIIAADINLENVEQLAQKLREQGKHAEALSMNVTNTKSMENGIDQILQSHKSIDILINNAGIDITKPLTQLRIEEIDKVLEVNLRAPFILSKLVFPIMQKQGSGYIVNITSTAAKRAWANASAYHASKWGLLGMTYALHVEGREKNIKVSAVVAGGMRTPFILERFPQTPLTTLQDPKNVAEVIKYMLLQPEESVIPEVMILPFHETSWP